MFRKTRRAVNSPMTRANANEATSSATFFRSILFTVLCGDHGLSLGASVDLDGCQVTRARQKRGHVSEIDKQAPKLSFPHPVVKGGNDDGREQSLPPGHDSVGSEFARPFITMLHHGSVQRVVALELQESCHQL